MSITKRTLKRPDPTTGRKIAYLVRVEGRRDPVTSKRRQYSKQVATLKEAKALEAAWTAEIARGTALDPSRSTVAELLDLWLDAKAASISPNSLTDYEIAVRRHLKPAFGTITAQRLGAADVQQQYDIWRDQYLAYRAELARREREHARWRELPAATRGSEPGEPAGPRGLSPRMIHRCHIVLSQALAQAVRFGIIPQNVCTDATKPSLSRAKPKVWTPDEARTFLDMAASDRLSPLWHFLLLEGMRRGEALGLRWQDVNWERGAVHISQTVAPDKSNRGSAVILSRTKTSAGARTVKLTHETLAVLAEHRDRHVFAQRAAGNAWQDHDLIICTATGTPINPNNVTRSFTRLVTRANVPHIRVHDLRHTAATLLLRAGVPAKIVSERLGHAGISITLDLYSHVVPDMQDVAADAMSALMARSPKAGTSS